VLLTLLLLWGVLKLRHAVYAALQRIGLLLLWLF
jgi:hypothetical protein